MNIQTAYRDHEPEAPSTDSIGGMISMGVRFLRRNWYFIVAGVILGAGAAAGFLYFQPPKYSATATILIDTRKVQLFQQPSMVGEAVIETAAGLESQLEILRSDAIAEVVIDDLKLETEPEFEVSREPNFIGKLMGRRELRSEEWAKRYRIDIFKKSLIIRRIGPTFVVEITFQSNSPALAARVANAVADAYINDLVESRRRTTRQAGEWLQERLKDLRTQSAEAQRQVIEFRTQNHLVDMGGKLMVDQQISELSNRLAQVRAKSGETRARLERAEKALSEYKAAEIKPTVPDLMTNPLTARLREQYFELANREVEWSERFGRDHQAPANLRKQMTEIRASMLDEFRRLTESYRSEHDIAMRQEADIVGSLGRVVAQARIAEQAQVTLRELETTAQSYRSMYDSFVRHQTEATQQELFPLARARHLTKASEPIGRTYKKPLAYAGAVMCGVIGLSFGLALLREIKDRTFRTGKDIEARLGNGFITMIPKWKPEVGWKSRLALAGPSAALSSEELGLPPRTIARSNSVMWASTAAPHSDFAEATRWVQLAVAESAEEKGNRVFGLVSVLPSEGTSTISAALAQMLAQSGAPTILVDCDLRHPALTRALAPSAETGLVEVSAGTVPLADAIWTDNVTGMAFLPAVVSAPLARPDELLASEETRELFETLRQKYEYIIVDLPPIVPMLDVAKASPLIDAFVGVVEWGSSKIDTVAHGLQRSASVQKRLLGVVLNKVDIDRLANYDDNAAEFYDTKRYANYRWTGGSPALLK